MAIMTGSSQLFDLPLKDEELPLLPLLAMQVLNPLASDDDDNHQMHVLNSDDDLASQVSCTATVLDSASEGSEPCLSEPLEDNEPCLNEQLGEPCPSEHLALVGELVSSQISGTTMRERWASEVGEPCLSQQLGIIGALLAPESHVSVSAAPVGPEMATKLGKPCLSEHLCGSREHSGLYDSEERMNGSCLDASVDPCEFTRSRSRSPVPPNPHTWAEFRACFYQGLAGVAPVSSPGASSSSGIGSSFATGAALRQALARNDRQVAFNLCGLSNDHHDRDLDLACDHASEKIHAVCQSGRTWYLGITENPGRRFDEHVASNASWSKMSILVAADSSRDTACLEQRLLATYGQRISCLNSSGGGERASAGSPHYLYMLVGENCLLRRQAPCPKDSWC